MTPEQIRAEVLNSWEKINWERPSFNNKNTSPYAEHLFNNYYYIPAVDEYYSVTQDGNYYHGYETQIIRLSKERIIHILSEDIAFLETRSCPENYKELIKQYQVLLAQIRGKI